jgi:hypothetical protein
MCLTPFLNVNMILTYDNNSANAFAGTFAFLPSHRPALKKQKSLQANAQGQCKPSTTDLRPKRSPAGNTGLAKVAVQCSADTFVVNQSLVLRINICAENRHLRQALFVACNPSTTKILTKCLLINLHKIAILLLSS